MATALVALLLMGPMVTASELTTIDAYRPQGYAAGSTSYWYPPVALDGAVTLARWNAETLEATAKQESVLMGGAFAGQAWSFGMDYVQSGDAVGGDAILSFGADDEQQSYGAPLAGLRLYVRRDAAGAATLASVLALGTRKPYKVVPFPMGRRRIVIAADASTATVWVDGRKVWSGVHGWSVPGRYPKLHLAPGRHLVSVVPKITVSWTMGKPADREAFRAAYVASALVAQDATGRFSPTNSTDAQTAMALIFEHRRAPDPGLAVALDRWAEGRVAIAQPGRAWPGTPGASSINQNVGEPGLALALWAQDRGRDDWSAVVRAMVEASGFTGCEVNTIDWCRMGNLQPDGTVIRSGDTGASYVVNHFALAETAAFIAGANLDDRRAWVRSLPGRTYARASCQSVETIGHGRTEADSKPWWVRSRKYSPMMLYLAGLAYEARPTDPVWEDPGVRRWLTCGLRLLQVQVAGPMGWDTANESLNMTVGAQDIAASRLLKPLTGIVLGPARFDIAWRRLIDPKTLLVRRTGFEPSGLPGYWTALAAVMLGVAEQ